LAYDAFISYSHAADGRLAPALQSGLQRLAKPWYRVRALRVFRDETGLSTNPDLWSSIVLALDDAEWFVLLASPESATSPWVDKEIAHWLEQKPIGRILPAVTAGEWVWDADARRLVGDSVPERLAAAIVEEPRHLDLRWAQAETDLDLRNSRFRSAVADLAAPMHGIAKDELEGEDIRQHRRARRLARTAVTALVLLTAIAVLFGIFAVRERNRAERQATVEASQRLAAQAQGLAGSRLDLALLLAVEARRLDDSVATRGAIEAVLSQAAGIQGFVPVGVYTSGAVRPDGGLFALARPDDMVTLQALPSGKVVGEFADGTTSVSAVAFSADGRDLVMGYQDGAVAVRDLTTGAVRTIAFGGRGEAPWLRFEFSPDGRRLAGFDSRGDIAAWDLTTSATSATLPGQRTSGFGTALAWSPDNRTLAAMDSAGSISIWDTSTRRLLLQIQTENRACVEALTFLPDGRTLAAGAADGRITLFDVATGRQAGPPLGNAGSCVGWFALSPDDATLVVANAAGTVTQWDTTTRTQRDQPSVSVGAGTLLGVLAAHDRLVTVDGRTLAIWRLGSGSTLGRVIARLSNSSGAVYLSPDGSVAFIGALTANHSDFFDIRRGQVRASYRKTKPISYAAWSPDGKAIAIAFDDGTVRLVSSTTGATLATFSGHHGPALVTAFSPDGHTLAAGGADGTALVWDVATHRLLDSPIQVGGVVYGVAFSPNGKTLAVASEDGTLTAYDLATRRRLFTDTANQGLLRVAFSPDDNTLAVASPNGTLLINPRTGRPQGEPLTGHSSIVTDVAFSSSGNTLATSSLDGTVILYDMASRQAIGDPLTAGYGAVGLVSYAPDGRTLAAGYGEGQIVLWDINPDAWQVRACNLADRNLTRDEWRQYLSTRPYQRTCSQWPAGR
jgi:WD40 repeat protein